MLIVGGGDHQHVLEIGVFDGPQEKLAARQLL
jgi:hypothetical protein